MAAERGGGEELRSGRFLSWAERLSETQFAYLLLVPMVLLLGIIAIWPLLSTFGTSLHEDALIGSARVGGYVGLDNYVALLTGKRNALLPRPFLPRIRFTSGFPFVHVGGVFVSALSVTLVFTVVSVFFETLIGFGQALVLNQDFRGRRWVRVAIIIPWAIPIVIQGMIFFLMFQPGIGFLAGTANQPGLLDQWGILSQNALTNPQDSLLIVIVADIWKTSAFMALLILAGLQSVDRRLYDVARVSGASRWQQFKLITLPLVLPTVLVAMLFRTIQSMRVYGLIETVAGCNTIPSLSCLVVSTWRARLYGTSAAVAFLTATIIAVVVSVYIVQFRGQGVV